MHLRTALLTLVLLTGALTIPYPSSFVPGPLSLVPGASATDQGPGTKAQHDIRDLPPGTVIEREWRGGDAHFYRIYLHQGQSLRVMATQKGETNLVVTALDPQQRTLTEVNALSGKNETETLTVVAKLSGEYFITVRPVDDKAPQGNYELLAEQPREAISSDRDRVAAQDAYGEARKLWREGTGASRRKAIPIAEDALRLWQSLGDELWEGVTLHLLGLLYHELGDTQKAFDYFNRALPLKRKAGARDSELSTLTFICTSLERMGRFPQAMDCWKNCLPLSQELGNRGTEATVYMSLGLDYGVLGDKQLGLDNLLKALAMHREVCFLHRHSSRFAPATAFLRL